MGDVRGLNSKAFALGHIHAWHLILNVETLIVPVDRKHGTSFAGLVRVSPIDYLGRISIALDTNDPFGVVVIGPVELVAVGVVRIDVPAIW